MKECSIVTVTVLPKKKKKLKPSFNITSVIFTLKDPLQPVSYVLKGA